MGITFDEYKSKWAQAFLDAGHEFQRQEVNPDFDGPDGPPVDWFVVDHGFHNGPRCVKCGWSCCYHCTHVKNIPECTGD